VFQLESAHLAADDQFLSPYLGSDAAQAGIQYLPILFAHGSPVGVSIGQGKIHYLIVQMKTQLPILKTYRNPVSVVADFVSLGIEHGDAPGGM
jgi:hypothetical protein